MSTPQPTPADGTPAEHRRGLLAGAGGYFLWGVLPLYFSLLGAAGALEITAHRVVWSMLLCLLLLAAGGQWRTFTALLRNRRVAGRLTLAAVLLAVNWITFLFGVLTGRVVDAALGYYVNPIITVLLAVLVLAERPRPAQWAAVGVAGIGVIVIAVGLGNFPWIAAVLALSFAGYGLVKKTVGAQVPALPGLGVETLALTGPALGYLVYLTVTGGSSFGSDGAGGLSPAVHVALLVASGIATTVPLLLFATAARRLPLATLGLLQYITPTMQFLTGVLLFGEEMAPTRWAGFVLVWVALVILTADGLRLARRTLPRPRSAG
ncbi:EamA family transporter RarD [Occultella glacieicola]|uniref:EamA family transporter RarD n=1 Tax=Occultella glacieicola TaxID=2518684 RepID=A0ABY2DX68_9MICO|nr:EamA family transporter RarD [Occultella glacieicola]TDE88023.1 EamA family transporter RarD [Occultella glacieicola]